MLRNLLVCSALAISLGGCATVPGGSPVSTQVTDVITQVQTIANQVCAFVPTAATVANILGLGNPTVATAGDVANAICRAVTNKSAARGERPNVLGVRVNGSFVRRGK